MKYYFLINGEQSGPFTPAQARALWNDARITTETLYWQEGMAEWIAVENLFDAPPAPVSTTANLRVAPQSSVNKEAKGWSSFEYVILIVCTIVIPFLGFIIGFIGVFNPAKRQQAATLMGLSILFMGFVWIYFNR